MENPEPKLQHFLPQNCHFNAFAAPELLNGKRAVWVHSASKQSLFQQIEKTGAINELYTIRDDQGKPNRELEIILATIESTLAPTIKKFTEQQSDEGFSILEKEAIATFVAMMKVRTPWHKGHLAEIFSKMKNILLLRRMGKDATGIVKTLTDKDHASAFSRDIENMPTEKINNFEEFLSIDNPFAQILLRQLRKNAEIIFEEMQWGFTLAHPGTDFVTCDNPVACCREDHTQVGTGLGFPDVTIYFAISPKIAFYGYKDFSIGVHRSLSTPVTQLKKEETDLFNTRATLSASKYIYSAQKDIDQKIQEILSKKLSFGLFKWKR
ncbi:hypothetical protein COU76_01750 [Candidatus Peregrinibacteria bacterium CG10_big_fil_rev_8_21_14_0_10_49_10]|nr:MAG: hypothetical protein COU76_01750 [Candidatus Peregrinibacteria bacterium CG10_big_fil_rev_8_21_14_0_10_49_10]